MRLSLRNPDLTTSKRIASAINDLMGADTAVPANRATVTLQILAKYHGNMLRLVSEVEQLKVEPDQTARIVVDDPLGFIVMGKDLRVLIVAIAPRQPYRHQRRDAPDQPARAAFAQRD